MNYSIPSKKLDYVECNQSGFHYGQYVNMVCVERGCLDSQICCCACIEEKHKQHKTKPLKIIIKEALTFTNHNQLTPVNTENIMNIIIEDQREILTKLRQSRQDIISNLNKAEQSIKKYYAFVGQQVKIKSIDAKRQVVNGIEQIYNSPTIQALKQTVKVLVSLLPQKEVQFPQNQQLNIKESVQNKKQQINVKESVENSNQQINTLITKNITDIKKKVQEFQSTLSKTINEKNIWAKSLYKFSSVYKHQNVKLVSDFIAKSINSSGYKFSVMEPSLQRGSKQKIFTFKIRQSMSNWVAIGMCHRNIVSAKNYGFSFGGIGHGAYLISSNGGSWSNINSQLNNSIKSFKFIKNDIIIITVDFQTKKIQFKCKQQQFQLSFQLIEGDQLHPCALFYYINDEVQFLPQYKQQSIA